jgi:hypothetical protein
MTGVQCRSRYSTCPTQAASHIQNTRLIVFPVAICPLATRSRVIYA